MIPWSPDTSLIVVDVQNDFADPAGSLSVTGGDAIIPLLNAQIAAARTAGALVVYTQDWHPAHTPHFAADGGPWPVHCVMDTWGAALHPDLVLDGPIVRKGTNGEDGYSGFTMRDPMGETTVSTALAWLLRAHGVASVVVCGLATEYCVLATALESGQLAPAGARGRRVVRLGGRRQRQHGPPSRGIARIRHWQQSYTS